jgi:uncharacterized protein YjbI with pentapeptide repeats
MPETTTLTPFIAHLTDGRTLPAEFDTWGFKIVRGDLTTWDNGDGTRVQWPATGVMHDRNAVASDELCPNSEIGGYAIAKDLRGARDGQYGHQTILLVAYNQADVLASGNHKARVSKAHVVAVIHGTDVYKTAAGVDLSRADFNGADLRGATFDGSDLSGAALRGARLEGASLVGADLSGANVSRAEFSSANLEGANFTGADGFHATFTGANLAGAVFTGAKLAGASLSKATVAGLNVDGAVLTRANLKDADGTVRNAGTAKLAGAVFSDSGPFQPLSVPAGRRDILDALTGCGVYAVMEGTR